MNSSPRKALDLVAKQFSPGLVLQLLECGLFDMMPKYECTYFEPSLVEKKQLIVYGTSIVINYSYSKKMAICIVADIEKKKLLLVSQSIRGKWTSLNLSNVEETIIDLDDTGRRWEGAALGSWPCGWGTYYNTDSLLEYQGFSFRNWNVCYGSYFYPDLSSSQLEYKGMRCFSKYYGRGVLYSRDGSIIDDTEWANGVSLQHNSITVPAGTASSFPFNTLVKSLTIESDCCSHVGYFVLSGCPHLKTLIIQSDSFSSAQNGRFEVFQCPELETISIGSGSFTHYSDFRIHDCPKLCLLECNSRCFAYCHHFIVESRC